MTERPPLSESTVRLLLFAILALAAVLRLVALGSIPGFSGDEGHELFNARQVAEHGSLALHPVRPYFGPYQLWLTAPVLKVLGITPLAARLVPALAGVGATWVAWRLGRRWGGDVHGLVGAALLGLAPWFVGYGRVGLSVAHVPAMTVLSWWLFARLLERPGPGRAAAVGLAVGATVVFHPIGMMLGAAMVVAALIHPEGRGMLRRPAVIAAAVAGFAATGWIAWALLLDQLGLGPGVDLALTGVDVGEPAPLLGRLVGAVLVGVDVAAGGRTVEWLGGIPSDEQLWLVPLRWAVVVGLGLAAWRAVRERDPLALGLLAGIVLTVGMTALKSGELDLEFLPRHRYLLVPVTLTFLLLPYGLVGLGAKPAARGRRAMAAAVVVTLWCGLSVAGLEAGLMGPMRRTGGTPMKTFVAAFPDAKFQIAEVILERTAPDEEGLLLAGDGWSYWAVLAFLGERMPADFVPESPEDCAAILKRTRHRRRYLVDYADGRWIPPIRRCMELAGYGADRAPLFVPTTPDQRPILLLWELPPDGPPPEPGG